MLGLLVLVTALIQSRFLSISELQFVLVDTTIFALLAIGETMVVLTRNVDLSVGSVLGLSAFLSADMFGKHPGTSIVTVFAVGLGIGVACGVANGLLTTIGRVPSLVVTLATLYIIRGIDVLVVGGGQVVASSLPNSFLNIPQATTLGIPEPRDRDCGRCRARRLLPSLLPLGPRAVRDRLEPGRRAARRHPDRTPRLH